MITHLLAPPLSVGGVALFLAGRALLSMAWPGVGLGRYYWEHCFWVDSDDFDNNAQMALAILADMKLLYTTQIKIESIRWYVPHTTTVYFQQIYTFPQFGSLTSVGNPTLLVASRWRLRGNEGSYSYHLHRQPLGEAYLSNGAYTPLGLTQTQSRMNTFIAQGIYRTSTTHLISSGERSTVPSMWQLRHGTKRRASRFWLP